MLAKPLQRTVVERTFALIMLVHKPSKEGYGNAVELGQYGYQRHRIDGGAP